MIFIASCSNNVIIGSGNTYENSKMVDEGKDSIHDKGNQNAIEVPEFSTQEITEYNKECTAFFI